MADDFMQLESWLQPLLDRLTEGERRKLALDVARELRRENAATIRAQHGPDGEAWAPRKHPLRDQRGQLRKRKAQSMFAKLAGAKHLRAQVEGGDAVVGFAGRTERIARVHHFGLRDSVKPGGPEYDYPARPLLGISGDSAKRLHEILLASLSL
ncbi:MULTISPECIES: phage virion morphogenesis protein [unclassified Acidovorax]|uniref:phage virion morphogenesis protein n=1 Tax=unclassified Acidovorax TaxID=2684926 RepID=UPI001C444ACE|nr:MULTISPECIES: phage virion morphogenesis protein [unclassified Acidovorax]MBV7460446.1 phage virion morphogenesis protein [Acidovorax sp. sif0632]MBV7465471.1 phage virion morphogenesis protein [Acidovorax sp. sif0613]